MSDPNQYWQQVGQWEEAEQEQEIQAANDQAAQERDEQFRAELEAKFPILKGWQ
jgi:hypothetical protein